MPELELELAGELELGQTMPELELGQMMLGLELELAGKLHLAFHQGVSYTLFDFLTYIFLGKTHRKHAHIFGQYQGQSSDPAEVAAGIDDVFSAHDCNTHTLSLCSTH